MVSCFSRWRDMPVVSEPEKQAGVSLRFEKGERRKEKGDGRLKGPEDLTAPVFYSRNQVEMGDVCISLLEVDGKDQIIGQEKKKHERQCDGVGFGRDIRFVIW